MKGGFEPQQPANAARTIAARDPKPLSVTGIGEYPIKNSTY